MTNTRRRSLVPCWPAGVSICLYALAACTAAPRAKPIPLGPIETGAGSITAARTYLEGRWSLTSYVVMPPGHSPITVRGAGTLSYDEYGNLDMQIRVDDPATADALRQAGIQIRDGMMSSTGRVAIDMQARTLTYILEGQKPLVPTGPADPLALTRPRHWEVQGNVLILTTRGDDGQPLSVGRWEKQEKRPRP